MKLTANNKTIDFFEFDDSQFDRVFLALSGGTDSAMLLYLTCIEKPDWKIVCHTGIDKREIVTGKHQIQKNLLSYYLQ